MAPLMETALTISPRHKGKAVHQCQAHNKMPCTETIKLQAPTSIETCRRSNQKLNPAAGVTK